MHALKALHDLCQIGSPHPLVAELQAESGKCRQSMARHRHLAGMSEWAGAHSACLRACCRVLTEAASCSTSRWA